MIAVTNNAAAATAGIRDIKPPLPISSGWEWVPVTLAALVLAAAAFFFWRWWQKRRLPVSSIPAIPPHVRAKQKLAEALALISQPKPFCVLVSDTIRFYLEERFHFHAPERTTEEFLRELSATDLLSVEQKESLAAFLENCDLVKFAKYEPGENELRELHAAAVKLVEETEPQPEPQGGPAADAVDASITAPTGEAGRRAPAAVDEVANHKS
ncbi:MAG TPA: hypothetical protein VFB55_05540 [Verrucomicrobiae bacterium]|nr:hypothetical protein [Verrucomicrobiae bacterium]